MLGARTMLPAVAERGAAAGTSNRAGFAPPLRRSAVSALLLQASSAGQVPEQRPCPLLQRRRLAWQAPAPFQAAGHGHYRKGRRRSDAPSTRAAASANGGAAPAEAAALPDGSVSVILLAGGVGKRMGASIPKQYLNLRGQPIATYALETFAKMREVGEIVIVCDPSWRDVFEGRFGGLPKHMQFKWALPGAERQDSVFNGLQQVAAGAALVAVHDSARPLVTPRDASKCMLDGFIVGAAVLGVQVKPTIKEVDKELMVIKTLQRAKLWEVQTPQCVRPQLLRDGFALVKVQGLEVTDDVSIVEAMGLPVKITPGAYTNLKVTTPDDMAVAEKFLDEAAGVATAAA